MVGRNGGIPADSRLLTENPCIEDVSFTKMRETKEGQVLGGNEHEDV